MSRDYSQMFRIWGATATIAVVGAVLAFPIALWIGSVAAPFTGGLVGNVAGFALALASGAIGYLAALNAGQPLAERIWLTEAERERGDLL